VFRVDHPEKERLRSLAPELHERGSRRAANTRRGHAEEFYDDVSCGFVADERNAKEQVFSEVEKPRVRSEPPACAGDNGGREDLLEGGADDGPSFLPEVLEHGDERTADARIARELHARTIKTVCAGNTRVCEDALCEIARILGGR